MLAIDFIHKFVSFIFKADTPYRDNENWVFEDDYDFQDYMNSIIHDMKNVAGTKFEGEIDAYISIHDNGSIFVRYTSDDGDAYWLKLHLYGQEAIYSYD